MESETTINIGKDFGRHPIGRTNEDGPFNGTKFRKTHLVPALRKYDRVIVELDDAVGYQSSFLEESFGGLIREEGFREGFLKNRLEIRTEKPYLRAEAWSYIADAENTIDDER